MGGTFIFLIMFMLAIIFIVILSKKTHAMIEFKAWTKGVPICLFFQDSRYMEWRPLKPDAGIITDVDYGAFIVNEYGTYVDRKTKAVVIPFHTGIATSLDVAAVKFSDDLKHIIKDDKELQKLRYALANGLIDETEELKAIKSSVRFSSIKSMMTALIPHNIDSKIEKAVAQRLKGYGKINIPQVLLVFVAILGAIILGVIIIKMTLGGGGGSVASSATGAVTGIAGGAPTIIPPTATIVSP